MAASADDQPEQSRPEGPLSADPEFRTLWAPDAYAHTCETAIQYAPAVADGRTLGYLWASTTGEAAGFVPAEAAGGDGWNSSVAWSTRLRRSKAEGLTALEALHAWTDKPEEPRTGRILPSSAQTAPSIHVLRQHQSHAEESTA